VKNALNGLSQMTLNMNVKKDFVKKMINISQTKDSALTAHSINTPLKIREAAQVMKVHVAAMNI
jgi:hypothetical protein